MGKVTLSKMLAEYFYFAHMRNLWSLLCENKCQNIVKNIVFADFDRWPVIIKDDIMCTQKHLGLKRHGLWNLYGGKGNRKRKM
jgi:hypothetical protein